MNTIKINTKTKLSELIKTYPQLRSRLLEVNPKFKMLSSPMGNIMIPKTTVADIESSSKINNEPEWLSQILVLTVKKSVLNLWKNLVNLIQM